MSSSRAASLTLLLILVSLIAPPARAQKTDPAQAPPQQTDDIIRVNTELVQTEVMVFDRHGRFVDGLNPEQFELKLGGVRQPVSFFERVTAGSATEAAQLAAMRGRAAATAGTTAVKAAPAAAGTRGRVIFFFLDDVHLSAESMARAREALRRFVDEQMDPGDRVAIVSASGQIGFLQQLTDHPAVLREAISRLNYRQNKEAYTGKTQISEYMASQVQDYANSELFAYLMESTKIEQQMGSGNRRGDHKLASTYSASPYLRNRIRQINMQGRVATADTLSTLMGLLDSSSALPGRKLVFFLSDGFIINERRSGALESLRSITDAAGRAGAVLYTMDLRGTSFGTIGRDAATNDHPDLSSRMAGLMIGEIAATQEPLKIMADQTGGRAILNSNSVNEELLQAVRETSDYYLLAWRPAGAEHREGKMRVQVEVKDRPDLRVRLRNNNYVPPPPPAAPSEGSGGKGTDAATAAGQTPEATLLKALGSLYPQRALPLSLSAGYMHTSTGPALKISMQIERQALGLDPYDAKGKSEVDVIGAAVDDRGQIVTFKQLMTVASEPDAQGGAAPAVVVWNQQLSVKPGLYQVRVAVRERAGGRSGSAQQWIEVPGGGPFQMSSLFLGERRNEASAETAPAGPRAVTVDVDHRFSRSSVLRFQTYIYNAARGPQGPDVWVQTQVFRNRQQVVSVAPGRAPAAPDPSSLPYWTEIALDKLPPGQYTLQVTATDQAAKASATQRVNFFVE